MTSIFILFMYSETYLQVKPYQEVFFYFETCVSSLLVIRIICLEISHSIIYTKMVKWFTYKTT